MTEKELIVNHRTINYKGIFRVEELLRTIDQTLKKLGYQNQEKKTEEKVFPSGRRIHLELRPFKNKTNYVTLMIKIVLRLDNIIEVAKEIDGVKKTFQQGDITLVLDAWSVTDYAGRWGIKPWFFFLKAVVNKYLYHFPLEENINNEIKSDAAYLTDQLNALLTLYRYKALQENKRAF